jgi:uncharacterized membrane protein
MAFCTKCGAQLGEGPPFCGQCGTPVGAAAGAPAPAPAAVTPAASGPGAGLAPNVAGLLTYFPFVGWIIAIVFLVAETYKNDKFVRFHAFQSLFLAAACFLIGIVLGIFAMIPFVGWILGLVIWPIYLLAILALLLFLMYKAYSGERFMLPFVGDLATKQVG